MESNQSQFQKAVSDAASQVFEDRFRKHVDARSASSTPEQPAKSTLTIGNVFIFVVSMVVVALYIGIRDFRATDSPTTTTARVSTATPSPPPPTTYGDLTVIPITPPRDTRTPKPAPQNSTQPLPQRQVSSPSPRVAPPPKELPESQFVSLEAAMQRGTTADLEYVVKHGANVNERIRGSPPLMFAVGLSDYKAVEILLSAGADPNALDSKERSALSYARDRNDPQMIDLLKRYGANK